MTISSVGTSLTPQQILQLLQQTQVGNADAEETGAAADKAPAAGQDVPSTDAATADTASTGAAPAPQEPLDPKTILALLKIQENQAMSQVNSFLLGDSDTSSDPLFGLGGTGSTPGTSSTQTTDPFLQALFGNDTSTQQTSDPLLQALNDQDSSNSTQTSDPFLQALNADPSQQSSIDPMLSLLGQFTNSANAGSSLTGTNQQLLDLLNGTTTPTTNTTAEQTVAATSAAESEA